MERRATAGPVGRPRGVLHRENRRLDRLLKAARLRVPACIEDIDYRHPRGLERSRMAGLASCDWIRQSLNLCITGPTGCGKTWLACALGNQACRQGLSVGAAKLTIEKRSRLPCSLHPESVTSNPAKTPQSLSPRGP